MPKNSPARLNLPLRCRTHLPRSRSPRQMANANFSGPNTHLECDRVLSRIERFIKRIKASKQHWARGVTTPLPPTHVVPLFWLVFPLLIHIHNRRVFFHTCSLHLLESSQLFWNLPDLLVSVGSQQSSLARPLPSRLYACASQTSPAQHHAASNKNSLNARTMYIDHFCFS